MFGQFEFLEDSRAKLFVAKNSLFKDEIRRNRSMKSHHLINGRDEALVDRNGAILSHPSDQRSKVDLSPRIVYEETRRFLSFFGSSSCDPDKIGDPWDALNVDRYNSLDRQFR